MFASETAVFNQELEIERISKGFLVYRWQDCYVGSRIFLFKVQKDAYDDFLNGFVVTKKCFFRFFSWTDCYVVFFMYFTASPDLNVLDEVLVLVIFFIKRKILS